MSPQIVNSCILGLSFLILFGIAELLYHYLGVKAEITRKIVHAGTGILTLLFPVLLTSHWPVLMLCGSFALILLLSLNYDFLKSINAIGRASYGSISYPAAVYACFYVYVWHRERHPENGNGYILFYLPVLILAICDPIAALCGKRWPYGRYQVGRETKTLMGSGMFFLSAFIVACILLIACGDTSPAALPVLMSAALIACSTAITEAICTKGCDNLFIPLAALLSFHFTSFLLA